MCETATLRAETQNRTDQRRARQRARRVVRELDDELTAFIEEANLRGIDTSVSKQRQINQKITLLTNNKLNDDLLTWLEDRRKQSMGRAARAAMDMMQSELGESDELRGARRFSNEDARTAQVLQKIDAGLIEELSNETGDRITDQLVRGFQQNETIEELGKRVDAVLVDGDFEELSRAKLGVKGQTIRSKGEMIAHDSIQDAYETAARERYLRNGFRHVRFDNPMDNKTSPICERLHGEILDITEQGHLVPPLHPWCRSDIIPVRDPDTSPVSDGNIADEHLETAMATKSFRPDVTDVRREFSPSRLEAMTPSQLLKASRAGM